MNKILTLTVDRRSHHLSQSVKLDDDHFAGDAVKIIAGDAKTRIDDHYERTETNGHRFRTGELGTAQHPVQQQFGREETAFNAPRVFHVTTNVNTPTLQSGK